jgi:hypothetical protein
MAGRGAVAIGMGFSRYNHYHSSANIGYWLYNTAKISRPAPVPLVAVRELKKAREEERH